MVVAGARRSRPSFGVGYGGANDLFGVGPRVAESRVDCAGPIAGNGNRTRMASLEGWNFTIKLCPQTETNCRAPSPLPSPFWQPNLVTTSICHRSATSSGVRYKNDVAKLNWDPAGSPHNTSIPLP